MACNKYIRIARKLQTACKKIFGIKLLIDQRQWYHKDKDMAVTVYTLYQVMLSEKGTASKIKLFQTYSQIQLVLFLRDFWYTLNNWEVPHDNTMWEDIKKKYGEQAEPSETDPVINSNRDALGRIDTTGTAVCDELYQSWKCAGSGANDTGII